MKKRFFYIISFLLIFCIEVLIALYVRDNFIRPYVGDMLVVVLVYSFARIFLPTGIPRMPFYVFLFTGLILRLIVVAERQHTRFARVYGYSVLSIFLFHLFINIGMVLGLTPVIGIPLPFFSYGGSSLWGFTILLFVFLRIDAGRGKR